MIGHMLNDLAKAIRRWTEKKSMEEIQMARPSQSCKNRADQFASTFVGRSPSIDVSNANMGFNGVRTISS